MESIWQATVELPHFPKLDGKKRCDVLVIGGGMAGILTAYFLRQAGADCIVVEKDEIAGKTTGGTTAKLTLQHGLIYHKLYRMYGEERARIYYDANKKALEGYESMIREKQLACDYVKKSNYVYARQTSESFPENSRREQEAYGQRKKLELECSILERLGQGVRLVEDERIELPFMTLGAVECMGQAQFHPLKFIKGLAKDLEIYEHTFVKNIVGGRAYTECGVIDADQIVVTTHFPFLNRHGSYFLKLYQSRSYVLALKGVPELLGMYMDENRSGMSFRSFGDTLLLGGGAHRTGKAGGGMEELRAFAKEHYEKAKETYAWAAQDCMSLDDIPYIGNYSAMTPKLYTATGFNKWGMSGTMLAAMLLADKVSGRRNEWGACFSPSRSMIQKQLFQNGKETAGNFFTFRKKRCTHLGCALKWNAAEHSWDCACHGSRFSADGAVLDNPAKKQLK